MVGFVQSSRMLSTDVCLSQICDWCFDIVFVGISCKVMLHLHSGCGNNTNVIALQRANRTEPDVFLLFSEEHGDCLLQAVNSVYINSHEVIMKLVYFLKAQLYWSQFETWRCDFKQNNDRCLVPSPMWEVYSCHWKLLRLAACGHGCSLGSSRHNYSSSPQITFFCQKQQQPQGFTCRHRSNWHALKRQPANPYWKSLFQRCCGDCCFCLLQNKKTCTIMAAANQKDIYAYKLWWIPHTRGGL